jgi:hypothetical protein
LQWVQPLPGNDLEINNEATFAATKQILNKQVYASLLGNAFTNGRVLMETTGATTEELRFLLVRAEMLSVGHVYKLVSSQLYGSLWREDSVGAVEDSPF